MMHHFSRLGTLTLIAGGALLLPLERAGAVDLHPAASPAELLLSNSAQGYLGVGIHDVDGERAAALKLRDPHGAEIISIDQDAPAGKSGLKVHDVVVQMNGQRVEGIEQFRRMLRESPPGRTISLVVIRESQPVNISVQLADRAQLATQIIGGLESEPAPASAGGPGLPPALPGTGRSGSFFGSLLRNRYYVGVEIQPLPTGLADYFGVKDGVLVGNVFPNSPGASAGLKPADVIQKVNGKPVVTLSDWERALHANHGKRIQVTIIRDHREQTLTMNVGELRNSGELGFPANQPDRQGRAELNSVANRLRSQVSGLDLQALSEPAGKGADTLIDAGEIQQEMERSRTF